MVVALEDSYLSFAVCNVQVLVGESFVPMPRQYIRVGDVVRVHNKEAVPADMVVVSSSTSVTMMQMSLPVRV